MRCPQCGRWNRASLPQCFYCGAPLPESPESATDAPRDEQRDISIEDRSFHGLSPGLSRHAAPPRGTVS